MACFELPYALLTLYTDTPAPWSLARHPGWISLDMQEFKIQNIVGSCDAKFPIRLEGLSYSHAFFATVSFFLCLLPIWLRGQGHEQCPQAGEWRVCLPGCALQRPLRLRARLSGESIVRMGHGLQVGLCSSW